MATNYDINYNDKRFTEVESDKKAALNEVDVTYSNMISQSDQYYDKQIQASKDWADKQTELQNQKTDFAIEKIEQEKAQAKKDYTKEQSGAYVDWQKQSNQYGANAEEVAAGGMTNTGFAESSQVSMYNTYQNRVATAREAFVLAKQNYDNAIAEARLQNSSLLAEIAAEAYQQQLALALEGFQYKNQLITEQSNKKFEVTKFYADEYQRVLDQINSENALKEQVRMNDASIAHQKAQEEIQRAQLAEEKRQFNVLHASSGSSGGSSGGSGGIKKSSSKSSKKSSGKKYSGGKEVKKSAVSGGSSSSATKIDTKSVLAAGLGPAIGDKIAEAVSSGKVTATQKGNTIYISKPKSSKGKGGITGRKLYSKYNF